MKPPQFLRFDTLYIALSYRIRSIASGLIFIIDKFCFKKYHINTYAHVFSADVHGGTTGRTLTDSTPYSMNSTMDVCSKVPDVCYFLD